MDLSGSGIRRVLIVLFISLQLSCLVSSLPKPCPKFDVLYGRTRSRSRGRAMRVICNRGYNLIGERTLLCNKGRWDSDVPLCAKTGCALPEPRIPGGKVLTSNRDQLLRTVCEDGFELQGSAVIFCNGIVWNDTVPLCVGKPGVKACDFEGKDHFCGWHQTRNMLGWQMGYDPLENWVSDWAPDFDHTYGGLGSFGHYVHMKGPSDGNPFVTSGQLKSPFYRKPDNPQVCFQFWFHVFGEEAGDLKVMVNREVVWSKQQVNRKLWQRGAFHFVANSTYQIIIEASVPHAMVTVAVDDLEVIENCTAVPDYALGTSSSCEGRCGDDGTVDDCSCDSYCQEVDNCCPDWHYYCPNISSGSDTTIPSETTVVTSKQDPPATTILPVEVEPVTNSPAEPSLIQNTSDQTTHQDQTEESKNANNNQNSIGTNLEDNNIDKINDERYNTNLTHNDIKDNNSNKISDEKLNENSISNGFNPDEEIDVPVESSNETVTDQVSTTSENTQNKDTPKSINVTESKEVNLFAINRTDESMNNNTANEQLLFEHGGISVHPNLSINKKRMRESVKKSTVVYNDEETQLNPTKNNTEVTIPFENTGNGTEAITDPPSPERENVHTKTTRVEDQTMSKQQIKILNNGRNDDTNTSISYSANTTDKFILFNHTELNKENLDIIDMIKTKDSNTEIRKSATNLEPSNENSLNVLKNESKNENDTTILNNNNTKSVNLDSPANNYNLNRNYTKIILYKSFNNENATNTNASNAVHTNDISRVQIHSNVQANGVPIVENVKKNDDGKYNESTIARLKQIHDHINNVISKRNTTNAGNTINGSADSNNATVLHKLKHFITTIIDSHNNSTLLVNSTDTIEKRPNVNVTVNNLVIQEQEKSSLNVTRDSSPTDSINSDGLVLLSEKTSINSVKLKIPETTVAQFEQNVRSSEAKKTSMSESGDARQIIQPLSQGVGNTEPQELPSLYRPGQNATWFSSENNKYSENFNLVRSYNKNMNETPVKAIDKLENTNSEGKDQILNQNNSNLDNSYEADRNTSRNTSSFQQGSTPSEAPSLSTKSTPLKISPTNKIFLNSPVTRYKPRFIVTRPIRFRLPPTLSWKVGSKLSSTLRRLNMSASAWSTVRPLVQTFTYRPINKIFNFTFPLRANTTRRNSTLLSAWRTRRLSTTTEKQAERNSSPANASTPGGVDLFSINLLKTMANGSVGSRSVNHAYKYEVWEETTGSLTKEHIVIQSASTNDDNRDSIQSSSLLSILSVLLLTSAVLLSTVTSYCLVQKYRRSRPDDTEIEYLTGDELLYFRTPSPHLRSSSYANARAEQEDDDVRTF